MISADTSSLIAYFQGDKGDDINKINQSLLDQNLILSPVVVCELLSDPKLPKQIADYISALPVLEMKDGYWQRVAKIRSILISKKLKARLADSMIAQICVDHNISLITRDGDFKNFQKYSNLKLN